ncbi:MAG: hypothetical protein K0Q59_3139 [Paenibacillus sp.]|nr:hypothetical protein [Paenibacillus sp.]
MKLLFQLGTAKIEITPPTPVPLAGFAARNELGSFQGVTRPLYARIFFFQTKEEDGTIRSGLVVAADLIWWGSERMPALRRAISERWGVAESAIVLNASHTHSGPMPSDRFTALLGAHDADYIQYLEGRLLEGIEQACAGLEPVRMEQGKGSCQIGVHRRRGGVMRANPDGPRDEEVNVIRYVRTDGTVKAVMVHYACHPVTARENYVSSEFPGAAMGAVEDALGGQAVAAFLQGCCGDINPYLEGKFCFGDDSNVGRLGRLLADEVAAILNRPMVPLTPSPIVSNRVELELPLQKLPEMSDLLEKKGQDDVYGQWSRLLLEHPERLKPELALELTCLRVADGLAFLAMNGEVVVEYGLFLKRHFQGTVLPLPYSNGMIGYIPTKLQIAEGGYESVVSCYYFGMPASFDPSIEEKIKQAFAGLSV